MGQGVAWCARELGLPCSVVVPDHAPATKLAALDRLGASVIKVPWDQANIQHTFRLTLVDTDEQAVLVPGAEQPVQVEGQFEVGRPPGLKPGTPLDFALAVNVPPLPLQPDSRYVWRLLIDGKSDEDWYVGFTTRPGPPAESQGELA